MKTINISIGDKEYTVKVADEETTRRRGLKNIEELPENKGMLFVWDSPTMVQMTMEDTLIPLDQIFIDEDYQVTKVAHRDDVEDDSLVGKNNTLMVLEVNINSGIKVGDDLVMEDDEETESKVPVMKVLAPDGTTQMELQGGERIFSRKNTKVLIRQAKKAYSTKADSDYKRLGKSVFKFLKILNGNTPEYVKAPE